jgi:putative NADH-flavin reductase
MWQLVVLIFLALLAAGSIASYETETTSSGLKIIVYGSTGRVGSRVVNEALSRGHKVTAVSRDPDRVRQQHENLAIVQGDILDRKSVAGLIVGQDVVVVSVRGSADKSKNPEKAVHRVAAELLVGVFRDLGERAPRLIYVGGAGSLEVKPGVLYADSIPGVVRMMMPRSLRQEIGGHVLTLQYLRTVDDVRWTYISPAKKFGPGKRTGNYRIGGDQMLKDANGKSMISMEDFAVALVDEAENSGHVGARFSVAY